MPPPHTPGTLLTKLDLGRAVQTPLLLPLPLAGMLRTQPPMPNSSFYLVLRAGSYETGRVMMCQQLDKRPGGTSTGSEWENAQVGVPSHLLGMALRMCSCSGTL